MGGSYITQEETLMKQHASRSLFIGIPKETAFQEHRVALVPSAIKALTVAGHRVMIESGAGEKSNFSDLNYSEAGAEVVYDVETVFKAQLILKAAPLSTKELDFIDHGQVIISPLHLPTLSKSHIQRLKQKKVTAIAWEYIKDDNGSFPIVRILSEIAGTSAVLTAADLLTTTSGGRGVLLGGISGVPSSKVIILGSGVVGEFACKTALGLGADVRVFDNDIYKLMRLKQNVGHHLNTSIINPIYLAEELETTDVVIGAMHSEVGRAPVVVSEEMVSKMKKGSVVVDISIDQGGVFATSRVTSHKQPTFLVHDVIHYCVPNMASRVARTASQAISNVMIPSLLDAAHFGGVEQVLMSKDGLRHGVYTYKGCLTNEHIGDRFEMSSTDINLLLSNYL